MDEASAGALDSPPPAAPVDRELLRRCMVRAKMEVVCTLLKSLKKELHLEKPGEFELCGELDRARDLLLSARILLPFKEETR